MYSLQIYEWKYSKHAQCKPSGGSRRIPSKQGCNSLSPRTKTDLEFHFPIFYMNYEKYFRRICFLTDTAQVSVFHLLFAFPSKSYEIATVSHCVRQSLPSLSQRVQSQLIAESRSDVDICMKLPNFTNLRSILEWSDHEPRPFRAYVRWRDIVIAIDTFARISQEPFWCARGRDMLSAIDQSAVSESVVHSQWAILLRGE